MNLKSGMVLTVMLALCGTMAQAAGTTNIGAAVEREVAKQVQKAEKYKGFNPHLTQAQMKEIPGFLNEVVVRLGKAGYHKTNADVAEGLNAYFEVVDGFDGYPTTEEMNIWLPKIGMHEEGPVEGDLVARARAYTIKALIPDATYEMPNYEVTNWKEYHYLCQGYMERVYDVLKHLANEQECDWDEFSSILCNLL